MICCKLQSCFRAQGSIDFYGFLWLKPNISRIMRLVPILLRGNLEEDLQYNFGSIYAISQGSWEIAIQCVAFEYMKSSNPRIPDPPPVNLFLYLSCNYVEDTRALISGESSVQPAVLSLLHLNIKSGEKKSFNFENRDFFQVSAPTQKLFFYFRDEHNRQLPTTVQQKMNTTVILLLRRRA